MSITLEHAKEMQDKPAVVCCRTTKGTVLSSSDLEDPSLFADLEESGLITLTAETLTIGEVLGATLTRDVDGLTALQADMLDGVKAKAAPAAAPVAAPKAPAPAILGVPAQACGGMIHIKADSITGLELSIPTGAFAAMGGGVVAAPEAAPGRASVVVEDVVVGTLEKHHFKVTGAKIGKETSFEGGVLTIREDLAAEALKNFPLLKKVEMDIITPDNRHVYSDTIMDVIPVATKVEGELGSGVTNCLDDLVFVLTGLDEDGTQVHEFGSSDGYLDEEIIYGRPGCPDMHDIMVRVHVVLQSKVGMERRGPFAAHGACDYIIQEVRNVLKKTPATAATSSETLDNIMRKGRPRILLVKEIMGQGAMHDNYLLPSEPAGTVGARANVDIGNVPIAININEVRDGAIHALCCIGPASKEMTRHYFREPLLETLAKDEELNLVGVVFIGSPQVNDEKTYVSKRLGAWAAMMDLDGAIVTTEGFGNNHIDFAANIAEIGVHGIPVVGCTFAAYQGQLIVGNKYMDALVDLNKDSKGFESEKLGENTLTHDDAKRAIAMLKNKLAGEAVKAPVSKWSQEVVDANQKLVG